MSELTRNLIDAIVSGKATDIETSFQATMADKISAAMEDRKVEVAQGMFKEAYSDKNPKIDLYHKDTGDYLASTNFSPTVKHAVAGYETKYPDMAGKVKASKAIKESIEELDESLIDAYKEHASFSDKVSHLNALHKKLTGAGYKTTDKLDPNTAESSATYHKSGVGSIKVSHSGTSQGSSFNTQVSKFGMTNVSRGNSSNAPANPVREELDD